MTNTTAYQLTFCLCLFPVAGFEPLTLGSRVECSTTVLTGLANITAYSIKFNFYKKIITFDPHRINPLVYFCGSLPFR